MAIASGNIVGHHLAIRTEAKVTWAGRPLTAGREGWHHIQGKASVLVLFQECVDLGEEFGVMADPGVAWLPVVSHRETSITPRSGPRSYMT
jgi:hypothetical protein